MQRVAAAEFVAFREKTTRLQTLFDLFQKLQAPGHPLRIALDKLQTLDLVRIIEDKS